MSYASLTIKHGRIDARIIGTNMDKKYERNSLCYVDKACDLHTTEITIKY